MIQMHCKLRNDMLDSKEMVYRLFQKMCPDDAKKIDTEAKNAYNRMESSQSCLSRCDSYMSRLESKSSFVARKSSALSQCVTSEARASVVRRSVATVATKASTNFPEAECRQDAVLPSLEINVGDQSENTSSSLESLVPAEKDMQPAEELDDMFKAAPWEPLAVVQEEEEFVERIIPPEPDPFVPTSEFIFTLPGANERQIHAILEDIRSDLRRIVLAQLVAPGPFGKTSSSLPCHSLLDRQVLKNLKSDRLEKDNTARENVFDETLSGFFSI